MPPKHLWFDAHLDLAYLAVNRRNMLVPLEALDDATIGLDPPAAITLPEMLAGGVRMALGTIFTEADGEGPHAYPSGDAERAHAVGRAQLEAYLTWRDEDRIVMDLKRMLRHDPGVGETRGGMGVAEVTPVRVEQRMKHIFEKERVHLGILMENADPIRSPDELPWWAARGVIAIGMAWAPASRYAGGNATDLGLTDLGRELVDAIDALRLAHDASHLSPRALDELLERTTRPIVATHSNCRALLGGQANPAWRRHLSDEQIRAITGRGGMIGINLYSAFVRWSEDESASGEAGRPGIEQVVDHIEHVCAIAGNRTQVGLGSDMDGGFSAKRLPKELERPTHLGGLAAALAGRGWSTEQIHGFCWKNWLEALERALNCPAGVPLKATETE